jgi:hypothetical protein
VEGGGQFAVGSFILILLLILILLTIVIRQSLSATIGGGTTDERS